MGKMMPCSAALDLHGNPHKMTVYVYAAAAADDGRKCVFYDHALVASIVIIMCRRRVTGHVN